MASPQPGPSHVQAQATPDGSPRSQDHVVCIYRQLVARMTGVFCACIIGKEVTSNRTQYPPGLNPVANAHSALGSAVSDVIQARAQTRSGPDNAVWFCWLQVAMFMHKRVVIAEGPWSSKPSSHPWRLSHTFKRFVWVYSFSCVSRSGC